FMKRKSFCFRMAAMETHNPRLIAIMVLSLVSYIIMVVFNAFAGAGNPNGPFLQTTGNVSNKFNTEITPAGWTFSIWGVIYFWLAVWLIYVFTWLCRRNAHGWMYLEPRILSFLFYISWIINNILNITWLFLWDRECLITALIILALIVFTNYAMLFFSYRGSYANGAWLQKAHKTDLWLIRVLVQNGVAVYATWTTIATLLNFAAVLTYSGNVSLETAGTVALSILLIEVVSWFVLENFVLDKYVRYTLTIYPVVIVALSGVLDKNYNASSPSKNGIYTAVLLGIACMIFAIRIVLVVWKHLNRPLYLD
uniref:Si:dkey-29d8.3 n=1 Tax=Latimeria chalumnae TaxID=7897 RepID=H3BA93_LATCH